MDNLFIKKENKNKNKNKNSIIIINNINKLYFKNGNLVNNFKIENINIF